MEPQAAGSSSTPGPLILGTSPALWRVLALATVLALALGVGLVIGRASGQPDGLAVKDPVSIGFARDMSVHHAQAVAMSRFVHRRTADTDLAYLAFDIMTTQQGQLGSMQGWLELWQQPISTPVGMSMTWMGGSHQGPMPGMATVEEVNALETMALPAMEEQFLRLMIRHHRGALGMSDVAAKRAGSANIRVLAGKMSLGQANEIEAMQDMLVQRGLPREPEGMPGHHMG